MVIKDLLFPRRCPVCDGVVPYGELICSECKPRLVKIKGKCCFKCGKPLYDSGEELCVDCAKIKHKYDRGVSLYEYNSVCKSIYRLKYKGRAEYCQYFGMEMARLFKTEFKGTQVDAIIPVPLHKNKLIARGYNQAQLLAEAFGKSLKIPVKNNLIKRVINTVPMKELDAATRQINLKNAFIMGEIDVKLDTVIIVDDIYTTGSTVDEISAILKKNGVQKVYYIALAIGNGL